MDGGVEVVVVDELGGGEEERLELLLSRGEGDGGEGRKGGHGCGGCG